MNQYYRKIGTVIKAVTVFLFIFLFANSISTQAQRVVYRYDTICKGDTGYHTFLDTLLYEDFEEELQDCWMSIYNWYYEQGIDARRSLCLRSSTEYITIPTDCFTPYEGEYAAFESDMRFYGDISMIITPKIEVFDPDNTFVSFYFVMPGTQYNSGYETMEVADEALCALSDEQNGYVYDLDLWHINDNSIVSYLTWTYYRNSFSGYTPGSYHVNFAHNNEGGFGFGLDNLLVYGPRKVDIPANVSSAEAGSTITTQQIYTGGTDCDVTVITQWYIKPKTSDTITVSHTGSYTWATPEGDGNSYSATGLYSKTGMTNSVGCDSTHYLDLTVMEEPVRDTTVTYIDTCATAYTWDTTHETYTTSGTYYYQASELHWEALVLTLKSASPSTTLSPNVCDTYTWSTLATPLTFTTSTNKDTTLKNQAGCDSLVQLRLTIRHSTSAEPLIITACNSYTWAFDGQTYTASDTYNETTINAAGCDSNATLVLTINSKIEIVNSHNACDSFYWVASDSTYFASAQDTLRATSAKGCDSLTILNLFVGHPSTAPDSVQTACDSFLWCGKTLLSSGQYPDTITNVDGCDSTVFLTLTINHSSAIEYSIGACDSFQWDYTGLVYRNSDTYRDTITNMAGCDSLITLNLTIQTGLEAPLLTSMICDEYTWSENGQTYTESGVYTDTLRSRYDCDSLVRLNLTILKSPQLRVTPDTTINICGKATIEAHGAQVYLFTPSTALTQTLFYDTVATVYANPRASTNYLITAYSLGPELVYNGDFSLGNEGFTTDHTYATSFTSPGYYNVVYYSTGYRAKDHTSPELHNNSKFLNIDATSRVNSLAWGQSVDVKPYTDYIFSMWATSTTASNPARLEVYINGTAVGGAFNITSATSEQGVWQRHYFKWNSGSTTNADIRIVNHNGDGSGNDYAIDDISLRQLSCATEHHVKVNVHIDTIRMHVCDAYTWREMGMTYTESGKYDRHVRTTSGCDSLRVLDLTIANTYIDTFLQTACKRFFWRMDSTMYTESGLYLWRTNHEEEGCDTMLYMRLSILDCDDVPLPDNVDEPWCTTPPPGNAFEMQELFHCDGVNAMSSPMVGDVDGDGTPEIVVCAFSGDPGWGNKMLVFDGSNGNLKYTINTVTYRTAGQLMSIADVDKDGTAEFFLLGDDGYLYCYSAIGLGQLWRSRERLDNRYLVMTADVNGDGLAEVVCGPYIYDAITGTLLLHGSKASGCEWGYGAPHTSSGYGRVYYMQALADIDFDGNLELCAANAIYKPIITNTSGTTGNTWQVLRTAQSIPQVSCYNGQTFLADFDNDGDVDVCVIGFCGTDHVNVYVWDGQTPDIIAYYDCYMGGHYDGSQSPSIPFAGDLDGNGTPEIIFNYPDAMRAFTWDDTLANHMRLMHKNTNWGETAGFTVFDFNQDGKEEIVYRNIRQMYIADGTTMDYLCSPLTTYSGTIAEYTIVADANGDGHANIVVCHAHCDWFSGCNADGKVSVFGSSRVGAWGSARKVWNQWAYSSVNINEDLTVPQHQFDIASIFPNGKEPFNGFQRQTPHIDRNGDVYVSVSNVEVGSGMASIEYSDTGAMVSLSFANHGDNTLHAPYNITIYADDYRGDVVKIYTINQTLYKDSNQNHRLFIPRHILCHVKADSLAVAINDAGYGIAQNGGQQSECDTTNNVVKIPFTPLAPPADTLRVTRCDKYVWAAIDTALYFSAVLNDTIPDHEGCDSVRWLELTINHSVFDTLDTLVCDIFQWRVNGEVYTADKVQTEYFNTIHGCDSIHHLILEMHYRFDTTEYREACNTFYWPVDRRTYTRSATHAERMLTLYGCDSIHELILTVYHTYRDTMYDTICHYDSRAFGGHSYNMSGHYYDTVPMMRECDTIHELFLHVKQELPLEIDWTSQCEQLQYTIFAFNPRGDTLRGQINWQAFPVDHELDWQSYNDTVYVHPTLNTVYSATLYYNDGSPYLCPETRTVQLTPTQEVKAEINASTVCFTPDILDLRATADGSGFSVIEWFVDGNYYSGLKTIHYHYDPETATADSVRVTLRVSNGYCHDADTFMIHYLVGALHVPNIFSPSEERISRFKVTGTGITEYTIRIYNRQGLIVFESESLEDAWDGKLKDGTKAEQGAYVYQITYRTVLAPDELKIKTGTVVLLR